jgi:hypothetical protein
MRCSNKRRCVHHITGYMKDRPYCIHLLDDDVLFQQRTICQQYYRLNEKAETLPFTYSVMICCSNNRRHVYNITSWMKDPILFHSLTRWWFAVPTIDDTSTISHVKWKTRFYSIHLLDDDVLFQKYRICLRDDRLNERREAIPFTYSMMICCSNNRRYVHNITPQMKDTMVFHSLTQSSWGVPTKEDVSTISQVIWKTDPIAFTYSMMMCCFKNGRYVNNITG